MVPTTVSYKWGIRQHENMATQKSTRSERMQKSFAQISRQKSPLTGRATIFTSAGFADGSCSQVCGFAIGQSAIYNPELSDQCEVFLSLIVESSVELIKNWCKEVYYLINRILNVILARSRLNRVVISSVIDSNGGDSFDPL